MKFFSLSLGLFFLGIASGAAALLQVEDADGKKVELNASGRVTVVIGSNENVAQATREAGQAGDTFQGRADYRCVVVVDLRDSLGNLAPPIVRMKMRSDLDEEGERLIPFYRKNGNFGDPRKDLSCVADFDGAIAQKLGWKKPVKTLRAVIFGKDGRPIRNWEDLKNFSELTATIARALAPSP